MANAIDQATDTSGRVDEADTSNTEDTLESLEADDTGWDDGDTTEASDTESAATEEVEETDEESDGDVDESDTNTDTTEDETDSDEQAADADEPSAEEAAERQRRNDEAAQRRIAEKQAREAAKQQQSQQSLEEAWNKAYTDAENAGFDEAQARQFAAQAMTAQQLINANYENHVAQVTNKVTADLNQAVAAIPEFRSDNPVIREAMLKAVDTFEAMHVQKDANGDPVQVTGDLLQFLQNEAAFYRDLTGSGAKQQEDAKSAQKKRTLAPPSRTPKQAKVDPDLAAFDAEAARW